VVTQPESAAACDPVVELRRELARAQAAEQLAADLETARARLSAQPMAASVPDAQAAVLAGLTGQNGLRGLN
jgi:hypothetical protein